MFIPPVCHVTHVICHLSYVMCQVSVVRCQVSHVTSNSQIVRARELTFQKRMFISSNLSPDMADGLLSTRRTPSIFFNQPLLVMRSLGEPLITTLKVVMGLCYKTLKQIRKLPVFCRVKKFQRVHFSTKYLKSTTRQY